MNQNDDNETGKVAKKRKKQLIKPYQPIEYKALDPKFGCKHYMRRCQLKCKTCKEFWTCRICHDDVKN